MTKRNVNIALGVSALLVAGVLYYFVVRPKQSATEKQLAEFESLSNLAGWDLFTKLPAERREFATSQWKSNLTRKEADQMINAAKNKKETLALLTLIKKWNPWIIKKN